jgi:hypothetical protein
MDRALLNRLAVLRDPLRMSSLAMIAGSLGLWVRAKTVNQDQRANAERRAIFVGLWPSMLWLLSDALPDRGGRRR